MEKFIGDAVLAVFGVPTVHEDDALRAVRAAAGMREALHPLNDELERNHGVTIANRIGVNTGEVVAGDTSTGDRIVTGDAVNTAARLEQAVFFVWFLGSLRTFLLRAEGMPGRLSVVAFGAGLLVVAIGAIGATVKGAVALSLAAHGDPGVVQGMYVLSNFAFTSTGFVAGVLVGATSIVVLRTKALPVWYGWIGVVLGVVFVLSALGTTTETGALSPTGNLQVIALTLFGLWILVTSILLVQRIGVKSAGPTAMPTMDSPAPTV